MIGEIQKYENLCKVELTTKWEHKFVMDIARELDSGEFVLCHRDLQLPNIMVRESSENDSSLRGSVSEKSKKPLPNHSKEQRDRKISKITHPVILSATARRIHESQVNLFLDSSLHASRSAQNDEVEYEIKFVDFEYAGFSSILWELGNFSAELRLNESQVQTLAQIYGNIMPRDIYKGQMLSNYIWALWSWIYNRIDLGRDYLARFDKNLKDLA